MNGDWLVPRFEVHGVEEPNLVEADDMSKIPAGDHIRVRDGRERDMKHVIAEPRRQDAVGGIAISEFNGLGGQLSADPHEREQLEMQIANELRSTADLCRE